MRSGDLLRLSTRMFRTRPTRTWLTILGISVGIGAVLFLVSLGYGLQNIILKKIIFDQALLSVSVTSKTEAIVLDRKNISAVAAFPEVADIAKMARFTSQITYKDLSGNTELAAVDPHFFGYAGIVPVAGKLFGDGQRGVVVSDAVLRMFGLNDMRAALGSELKIQAFIVKDPLDPSTIEVVDLPDSYVITAVIESGQDAVVFIPLQDLGAYTAIDRYERAQVTVKSVDDIAPVKEKILNMGFEVTSLSEIVEQANKIFRAIQIILGVFGAFSLVVSAIGMFNTMTVTLLERTNEIGIMRALGAGRGDIQATFLSEAVLIGFLGGAVGIAIGIGGGELFNFGINSLARRLGGSSVDLFRYPQQFLLVIMAISTLIGFFSGVFPARRAAAMDPLQALRYK